MDLQVIPCILGSFGHLQGGLWLGSLNNSPVFAPSFGHKSNLDDRHRPDDHLRNTVHHSFDPLGAGEMDLQVILVFLGHLAIGREDCGSE
jgi:hypothetical protein